MQVWTWPPVELSDGAVEAMKCLGLILMTADHAQKYGLMPAVPGIYETGRMAFPLFGIVLAYNLVRVQDHDPHVYVRVLTRLLCCGALASIPFIALGGIGFGWWPGVALCVGAWLYCKRPTGGALLLWLAGTAGLTLINGNWWAFASFAVLVVMSSVATIEIPRASRFFYLYYPAHLAVLLLLGLSIPSHS